MTKVILIGGPADSAEIRRAVESIALQIGTSFIEVEKALRDIAELGKATIDADELKRCVISIEKMSKDSRFSNPDRIPVPKKYERRSRRTLRHCQISKGGE